MLSHLKRGLCGGNMSGKKVIVFRLRKQADMRKCHLFEIETKYDSGTHQEEEEEEQRLHDLRQLDLNFLPSSSMLSSWWWSATGAAPGKVHSGQKVCGESFNCPITKQGLCWKGHFYSESQFVGKT